MLRPQLANADIWMVEGGTVEAATELRAAPARGLLRRASSGSAAAGRSTPPSTPPRCRGLPMVAVATSLAHDGIASPVASLEEGGRKARFGVQMPIAVVVDLDYVRASDAGDAALRHRRRRLQPVAIADWWLAARERGEPVDGAGGDVRPHRRDGDPAPRGRDRRRRLPDRARRGARALRPRDGRPPAPRRPCSGGDHEILHAIDHLFPGTAHHGELAGVGSLFTSWLRGDAKMARDIDACLTRHGLPRTPADLGLDRRPVRQRRSSTRRRRGRTATRSSSTSTSPRRRWGTASARTQTAYDR